jgi:Kef-type K+ transport system membrane component KefB
MRYLSEQQILVFLVQLFILLGLSRLLGEFFSRKLRQPALTAEILVGILLGPTLLGKFAPAIYSGIFPNDPLQINMLQTVAWLGAFFLLLEAGLEIDFLSAWRQKGDALTIALTGVVVPLVVGFVFCLFLPDQYLIDPSQRVVFALFLATILSITAMPVASRVLHDLKLSKTDFGFLVMSAHSVNDIIGWFILTLLLAFLTSGAMPFKEILGLAVLVIGFISICLSVGRWFTHLGLVSIRVRRMPEPSSSLTFICLLGLLCGAITQKIGIHALIGFFLAGIMAGGSKALPEKTRQVIAQMIFSIFVPLFFASIGLRIDFWKNFDLFLIVFLTILSIVGKFLGGWLGARLAKLSKSDSWAMGVAHTPGGTMEIVVGIIALENGAINEPMFVAIVFGAIFSSILVGPWLQHSIRRKTEQSFLELLPKGTVIADLKAKTRDEAVYELAHLAAGFSQMPSSKKIAESVLIRENVMGTAIEEGVAIPHARMPKLDRSLIVYGRSLAGIEWNSPDGKPTHQIFLILTPDYDNGLQLQILRTIASVMSQPHIREFIFQLKEEGKIWNALQKEFATKEAIKKSS